jgi:hypothetical protein
MASAHPTRYCLVLLLTIAAASSAQAQLAPVALPDQASAIRPVLPAVARDAIGPPVEHVGRGLAGVRLREVRALVRNHRPVLDTDRHGAPVIRGEVIAIDPTPGTLERAIDAGFTIAGERNLEELELRIVVLRARPGVGTRSALRRLRRLDTEGSYDFNHLYLGSGAADAVARVPAPGARARSGRPGWRVGLVDTGVDGDHPSMASVGLERWGCEGEAHPEAHGTAVASLLAGGAVVGPTAGTLYAADIYCGQPTGGNAVQLAEALAWMARERVTVINVSLVGPDNRLLQRSIQAMVRRGHVVVAAVGNDGPNAAPLYPAAYPGVIGVTGVDRRLRVLPEAVRGPQVSFAAPGAELRAALPGGGWGEVRGTSYAAPLVARLAAVQQGEAAAAAAAAADQTIARLAALAADGGQGKRSSGFGHGLLGIDLVAGYGTAETASQAAR